MPLRPDEQKRVADRVAAAEARTGAQIVAALVGRCDRYPELPWKAFALGVALASFLAITGTVLRPAWDQQHAAMATSVAALAAGAALALLTVLVPRFARVLLDGPRAEAEVRQHAEALFLRHELFGTRHRCGVLILASEFERRVVVLPDVGVRSRVTDGEIGSVIAAMRPALAAGRTAEAFVAGLEALERVLVGKGLDASGPDEIAERVVQGTDA